MSRAAVEPRRRAMVWRDLPFDLDLYQGSVAPDAVDFTVQDAAWGG
jgi:hypothetical protein